jgi:glycosyltransferase involved in cell wall biosynthesis
VHNSEEFIESSVKEYYSAFSKIFDEFEIIIVCNDCEDDSYNVCMNFKNNYPKDKIKIFEIPRRGKGYALLKGFSESRFEIMGFIDSDNPFGTDRILKMIKFLSDEDMVIASKYLHKKARQRDSQLRRIISIFGGVISRIMFGLNFKDTQAGAKFWHRRVWNKINTDFVCRGFDFDIELLYKTKKAGFKIKEFYTPIGYEKFSTFRLKFLPGMVKRLIKLRFFK